MSENEELNAEQNNEKVEKPMEAHRTIQLSGMLRKLVFRITPLM